jgi:hypothetical protein
MRKESTLKKHTLTIAEHCVHCVQIEVHKKVYKVDDCLRQD